VTTNGMDESVWGVLVALALGVLLGGVVALVVLL
jgi:hypothetical protein